MNAETKALHLLNRLAYGPRPGEVESLSAGGEAALQGWLNAQLHPEAIPDGDAQKKLATLESLKMDSAAIGKRFHHLQSLFSEGSLLSKEESADSPDVHARYYDISLQKIVDELRGQRLILAAESRRQLNEVLFEFWWNHFNVDWTKIPWTITSYERDAIRPHLFGKFRELLRATAHHPCMLWYLDNVRNISRGKGAPFVNENYARELMELHSIGVDAGYTQNDVTELSRMLSGWGENEDTREFEFFPGRHDPGAKTFLGKAFPAQGGQEEGETALDTLAAHPAAGRFLATKLVRFFVSDTPQDALVERVAQRFKETDGDLREVYGAIFNSPEFWSDGTLLAKIKRPFQFVVSGIRGLGGTLNSEVFRDNSVHQTLVALGEPTYSCSSPTGYRDDPRFWVNPGSMVLRMKFSARLAEGGLRGVLLPPATSAEEAPKKILGRNPSAKVKNAISGQLLRARREELNTRLVALTLASPDFQRR